MLYAIVGTVVLILDQLLKLWVNNNLPVNTGIRPLIPGVIHLTNIHNTGASFGLFAGSRILLLVVLLLFTAAAVFLLWKGIVRAPLGRWSLVLLLAGALGNGIDRALFGYVVDMFEFEFFTFAIFNISDLLITVCGVLFLVHVLLSRIRGSDEEPEEEEEIPAPRPKRKAPPQKRPRETVAAAAAAPQRRSAPTQRPAAPAQRPAAPAQRPAAPAQRPAAPAQRPAAPAQRSTPTAARPAVPAQPKAAPVAPAAPAQPKVAPAAPVARPSAPAPVQPKAAPAPEKSVQPAAAPAADNFDLDAILAEFK